MQQFKIANIEIAVHSNIALSVPSQLQLFTSNAKYPDFCYECQMQNQLPKIPEASNVQYYFDSIKNRNYAITEELEDRMLIHLSEENLPWGTDIHQMYEQFALPHILLKYHKLVLHASYIVTDLGAILFTAPSGTGKSTQAELWRKHRNAEIINGDRAVIGIENGVAYAYGYPISGSSDDCQNVSSKICAIVSLKQAKNNSIRKLCGLEALTVMMNGSYLSDRYSKDLPKILDLSAIICEKIPIFELSCLPDIGAIETLLSTLSQL